MFALYILPLLILQDYISFLHRQREFNPHLEIVWSLFFYTAYKVAASLFTNRDLNLFFSLWSYRWSCWKPALKYSTHSSISDSLNQKKPVSHTPINRSDQLCRRRRCFTMSSTISFHPQSMYSYIFQSEYLNSILTCRDRRYFFKPVTCVIISRNFSRQVSPHFISRILTLEKQVIPCFHRLITRRTSCICILTHLNILSPVENLLWHNDPC